MSKFYVRHQEVSKDVIALSGMKTDEIISPFIEAMFTDVEKSRNEKLNGDYGYLIKDLKNVKNAVIEITNANENINQIISKRNLPKIKLLNKILLDMIDSNNQIFEIVKYWNFLSNRYNQLSDEMLIIESNIDKIEKKILINHADNIRNDVVKNKMEYYKREILNIKGRLKSIEAEFSDRINTVCIRIEVFNDSALKLNKIYTDLISTHNKEMKATIYLNKDKIIDFESPSEYIFKNEMSESIAILGYIDSGDEDDKSFWMEVTKDLYRDSVISKDDYESIINKINKSSFQFGYIILQKLMNYGFDKIAYYKSIKDFFDNKDSYKIIDLD